MSDDPEETQEIAGLQLKAIPGQRVRQAVHHCISAIVGMAVLMGINWALSTVQDRAPVENVGAAALATWTATPSWGRSAELQVGDRVEGAATPTPASDTEARMWRIIDDLEGRLLAAQQRNVILEEELAALTAPQDVVRSQVQETQDVVSGAEEPPPWESPHIQPDLGQGSECTPPNRGLVLCGVPEGVAYAVYDARGRRYPGALGTVPSAAEMAQHLGRDAAPVELWRDGNYAIHYHPEAQEIAVFHGVVCIWTRNRLGKIRHG
ncbi:MAG: hypothetical protein OXP73_01975 [Chloroflexota bacterium]|nr:hypothetical protein [Chloroflexota bacterium]